MTGGLGWLACTGHCHLGGGETEMNMGRGERAGRKNRKRTAFPSFLFKSTEQLEDNYAKCFLFTSYHHVVTTALCLSFTHTYVFFILISE